MIWKVLAVGYTREEQEQLSACMAVANKEISIKFVATEKQIIDNNQFNCVVIHPKTLDSLPFIHLLRHQISVPVIHLIPENFNIFETPLFRMDHIKSSPFDLQNAEKDQHEKRLTIFCVAELELCIEHRTVIVGKEKLKITAKEFDILSLLISNPKRVFTYEMIMELVWNEPYNFYSRKVVSNHISNIKRKIRAVSSAHDYIVAVHSIGYKFELY